MKRLTLVNSRNVRLVISVLVVFGMISGMIFLASPKLVMAATNLALGQPAYSSSDENSSFTPDNAVDGDGGTRWSSAFSDPQWIYVDLGATYTIDQVVLEWEAAYGSAYQIQVSDDASSWTTIYSTSSGNGGTDDLSVSGSGRYVRMYGTTRGTVWGYSLWEFEVYAGGATPTVVPPSDINVNFQPAGSEVPSGYLADTGAAYGDRGNGYTYGWLGGANTATRDRGANPDQRYDTLNHFQKEAALTWEIAVPNGTYDVFLVAGDPSYTDQVNTLSIEGVVVTDPDGMDNFDEYSVQVVVSDGQLTVVPAAGASNAKICFIDISAGGPAPTNTPAPPTNTPAPTNTSVPPTNTPTPTNTPVPPTATPEPGQQPYGGVAWAIPGTIQAEDYDVGGEGVAYHDTTPSNSGGAYRSDGVDIEVTTDSGGGYDVGWIASGEWLEYTVDVASSDTYYVEVRVASLSAGGTLHIEIDGVDVTGAMSFGATGGWQSWTTVTSGGFSLSAGQHILRIAMDSSSFNVNWVNVASGAGPTATPVPPTATPPGPWTLVWSDEFDGPSIDVSNWNFETGCSGWGNAEWENYTNGDNSWIEYDSQAGSNVMIIEARDVGGGNCGYTSSRMTTQGKREFTYGRVEARLKLPQTQGIWPAFWMLGDDIGSVGWPSCGEIDIMEHVGFEPTITHAALHGPGYSGATPIGGAYNLGEQVDANYHVYALEWDANGLHWYVDDVNFYNASRAQVESYGPWVFDHEFFILLNVAVGGQWPGYPNGSSVFPQRMYVDYVRVYQ